MAEQEIKSLVFKLKENDEPITIDFFKLDLDVLCQITRVLDIEGYMEPLVIKVGSGMYREIGHMLVNDHWLINVKDYGFEDGFKISLNGFKLIFKREQNEFRGNNSNGNNSRSSG